MAVPAHPTRIRNASVRTARAIAAQLAPELRRHRSLPSDVAVAWAGSRLCGALLGLQGVAGESRAEVIDDCVDILEPELCAAFRATGLGEQPSNARARRSVRSLLAALPKIQRTLMLDLHAAYERDPAATSRTEIALAYPGIRALCIYRIAHHFHRHGVPLVPRILTESAHASTGIDIHPGAEIGAGCFIDHGTSVVIGETTVIGRNCTLYQGVTLGARRFDRAKDGSIRRGLKRHPTLRDGVTVYANATILGGSTIIGSGSTIAASVLVQESVPSRSVVRPGKNEIIVARSGRTHSPSKRRAKSPTR
ncbi:MAG: serine O-acetyltransferase [Planctomycetota bacterium]